MQLLLVNHWYKQHEGGIKKKKKWWFYPTLAVYITNCWAQGTDLLRVIISFPNSKGMNPHCSGMLLSYRRFETEGEWFIWNPDISQQNLQYSGTERVITRRVIGANKANTAAHFLWQSSVFKMIVLTKEKQVVVDFLLSAIFFQIWERLYILCFVYQDH